ncbi:MAG: hypothetical protein E6G68_08795 [Actinobacteria bacterium]|nr:MAG: hypothetical protein E6G68_08795 [Actinomycetota bacterium]
MPGGAKPLGEVLVDERLISREQLQQALLRQEETGKPLGKILIEMGLIEEKTLVEAVSKQIGIPFVDLETARLDPSVAAIIPIDFSPWCTPRTSRRSEPSPRKPATRCARRWPFGGTCWELWMVWRTARPSLRSRKRSSTR